MHDVTASGRTDSVPSSPQKFYHALYFQVPVGVIAGIRLGHFWPEFAAQMKPLGDAFIKIVKMMIVPVVFCTIVIGIATVGADESIGGTVLKAMALFYVLTTVALATGLVSVELLKPGVGMHIDPRSIDPVETARYVKNVKPLNYIDVLLLGRAWGAGVIKRLQPAEAASLLPRGTTRRSRHRLDRTGAPVHVVEARETRVQQGLGRPDAPSRLLVQPRWNRHLPDARFGLPRAGDGYSAHHAPDRLDDTRHAPDVERRGRRDRQRFRGARGDARRHAGHDSRRGGRPHRRHRSAHVRGTRPDTPLHQR